MMTKFCIDCKNHTVDQMHILGGIKTRKIFCCEVPYYLVDLVRGPKEFFATCETARDDEKLCGQDAKHFESKEQQ